ncbi:MAG: SDR family oxidoreductase [Pseudolabrys sp.]|nr:SDR family oxidoreductase [Pseudolabrys sp.]MDP2297440.1 SDR family oxidoreductase [Pseudolabrys sp.]
MSPQGSTPQPVCLITGASAGIGAALAHEFASHGHALVLTARRETELNALADAIAAKGHPRPRVIASDLGQPEGPGKLAAALQEAGLEPAVLVNNAGFGLLGDAARLDLAQQLAIVDLNNRALTDLTLRFIGSITRHKGGILNVASIAAFMPGPGMAVYHASKAYVVSLSEALHEELKADGVKVCALCPGPVPTEFNARASVPHDYFPEALSRSAERVAREGYDGFMAGHRVVVPGGPNRIATLLPRLLPRGLVLAYLSWRWARARRRG